MHQNDFDRFVQLMTRIGAIFSKKLDDDIIQGYWNALKDLPLSRIHALADDRIKRSRFFPKPVELRPKDEAVLDGKWKAADERCIRNLEEMRLRDPVRWENEVRLRRADRMLAVAKEDSSEYAWAYTERDAARKLLGYNI